MKREVVGSVIASFGRHLVVRTAERTELRARPFGRALEVVCGDEVRCRIDAHHEEVHVIEVLKRRNALWRANSRGGAEPVVANLTRLLVVLAPLPQPDLFVVDRYLCAATAASLPAALIVNKADLGMEAQLAAELEAYAAAGFVLLHCSAASGAGMEHLPPLLGHADRAALVGQSGVGKSSLIRRLLPQAEVAIGALVREEDGRHTTTAARLFDVPGGAELIDSPGVRDFAPAVSALDERTLGFPEIERLAAGCRFADCRHLREPGCAVRSAAEYGSWSARRYESYRRLRRLYEQLRNMRAR
ncbi:MAG TPA: ribosome small subunit-dependent GTPase A [Steroidobacteraceae bacterium]|nr:ribosome small subunit-dependent GTPase A [Steroidobacteraceae bacterium]